MCNKLKILFFHELSLFCNGVKLLRFAAVQHCYVQILYILLIIFLLSHSINIISTLWVLGF